MPLEFSFPEDETCAFGHLYCDGIEIATVYNVNAERSILIAKMVNAFNNHSNPPTDIDKAYSHWMYCENKKREYIVNSNRAKAALNELSTKNSSESESTEHTASPV